MCLPVEANIYSSNSTKLAENLFKETVPLCDDMVFTYVPRGLVVSIDSRVFFKDNNEKLMQSGLIILRQVASVLRRLENDFVIEGHMENLNPDLSIYGSNWEISLARANNVSKFLIKYANVPPEKIFTVGFGEFMPFKANASCSVNLNNRIDFVILDYEVKR